MNEIIVGIDLGTTNSEVAIVQDGKVVVITDETNNKILPSFVGLSEGNEVLVGTPAKNQYVLYPERTVKSIKRKMGEDVKVDMAGQLYTPQEISAMILKRLKQIAENYLKQPVNKAVITVPAYFSDSQRQATREAGQIAGLEVVRIINEPTAAALVYESQQKAQKRVLVYDLGGGTFDVSVVSIQDNVVEVVASHGNNKLGGDDFDQKIIDYVIVHLKEKYGEGLALSRKAIARITRAAEAAKIVLSNQPYSLIEEEYLDEYQSNPVHLSLELSRVTYETMITVFIDETLEAVHIALDSAKLKTSDIDEILLVGGSTRTPLVSERLEKELRIAPRSEIDPDLCVASGAAIQAAMIAGENVTAVLVDITPYTFGTSAIGELNGEFYPYKYVPIIHKNSALPMTKTEAFYTVHDNQETVDIRIYQGEDADALANIELGQFYIKGLSRVPSGNVILLTLELDLNGILNVSAKEKRTGLEKSIVIDNAISRFEENELVQARERVHSLFSQSDSEEQVDTQHLMIVQARALIEKAGRMLDKASSDDREDIIVLIEEIKNAITQNNLGALKKSADQLSDILYYMES